MLRHDRREVSVNKGGGNIFDGFSRSSSLGNVFVVSLAFADLVVAFYPYPLVLYALFHDGWALGNTQCMVRVPPAGVWAVNLTPATL